MHDVRHVVAMTFVDEEAMPDELFRGGDPHRRRGEDAGAAVANPTFVDARHAVPHPVDEIDEVLSFVAFASQCLSSSRVTNPAARRTRAASGTAAGSKKRSRSLVLR